MSVGALVGHLQEEQERELLQVVLVAQAVVAQDLAVAPELLDDAVAVMVQPASSSSRSIFSLARASGAFLLPAGIVRIPLSATGTHPAIDLRKPDVPGAPVKPAVGEGAGSFRRSLLQGDRGGVLRGGAIQRIESWELRGMGRGWA